ncbi:helix-turn-helix domain-containing protein [Streptomyces sp. NPDC017979]|uniref:helix-turn-helix domain-containing protein n=1 Tax=Streptomyces sp. NPDC017979 TaxID=3365024 RepID=UPI00378A91DF
MSTQGQAWVDKVGIEGCKNSGELLVLIRVGNHVGGDMRGCFAKAATLAKECLMGESTVLKHLRNLKATGVLLPGDEKLVDHIRADKRPPVYDLAGGHETGCPGGHPSDVLCETVMATGVQIKHPTKGAPATGARSEHPQKKPRSAGARSEHPTTDAGVTGVQIDASRVFKSSGRSNKEVKLPLSLPAGGLNGLLLPGSSAPKNERESDASLDKPAASAAAAAALVPPPRPEPHGQAQPTQLQVDLKTVMDAYIGALGVYPTPSTAARIKADAEALLALAWPVEHVAKLAGQLPGLGYTDLSRHADHNPPPAPKAARPSGPPKCERHPAYGEGDCPPCVMAERERQRRGKSAPASVDGARLLARLRAGQNA